MKTIAKISALIIALAILLTLAACGGAKDAKEETAAATHAATEVSTDAATDAATEAESKTADAGESADASPLLGTWSNSEYGTAYTFNADGKGTLTGKGYAMDFTYEDKGDTVEIMYSAATQLQSIEYTIDGDTITLAGIEYKK